MLLGLGLVLVGEDGGVSGSEGRGDVFGPQLVSVVDKKSFAVMARMCRIIHLETGKVARYSGFDVGML